MKTLMTAGSLKFIYSLVALLLLFSVFGQEKIFWPDPAYYLRLIHADRLHARGLSGKGVTIAVIDEGFEEDHPFLKSRLSSARYNTDNHGENIRETLVYKNGKFIFENHGTHISSILMSTDARCRGIAHGSQLLPVKLGEFHGDQAIVRALDYVTQSQARIVNLSFALSFTGRAISPNVRKALERLAQADKLMVIAAGNEGQSLVYSAYGRSLLDLAASPEIGGRILLVGAYEASLLQQNQRRAAFSNFPGTAAAGLFFLNAPGVEIEAAFAEHKTGKLSGTSMAAPMVCGVAALLMEAFPAYSAQQIASLLLKGARKVDAADHPLQPLWGQGLLDAVGAYTQGLTLSQHSPGHFFHQG